MGNRQTRVVVCPDSFKGSLSAAEAARIMHDALSDVLPDAEVVELPLGDGGEGTAEAIAASLGGHAHVVEVRDAAGMPAQAVWYELADGDAVLDVASAVGLAVLPYELRDPLRTTSFGAGQLIEAAAVAGARRIWVGLGGSATNDGGLGMLCALGARAYDAFGQELYGGGQALGQVARLELDGLSEAVRGCELLILCDVAAPLLRAKGATYVFGPQKGADPQRLAYLEEAMSSWAALIGQINATDMSKAAGAGAAGGLGFALASCLGAQLVDGGLQVLDVLGAKQAFKEADLVVCGEGALDTQTLAHKAIWAVGKLCAEVDTACVAVAGRVRLSSAEVAALGLADAVAAAEDDITDEQAFDEASERLAKATRAVVARQEQLAAYAKLQGKKGNHE